MKYSTTFDVAGNNQICRIYHLGVASLLPRGATGHCQHGAVSGGGACGNYIPNLCALIGNVCGFGANATWQFADNAACLAGLALGVGSATNNISTGVTVPLDTTMNTHECRFYHVGVAASFLPGAKNGGGATALSSRQAHCSHVISRPTATGGCGVTGTGTTPTAAPGTPTAAPKSSSSTLSVVASGLILGVSMLSL
jgi:hypothetical protein